MKQYSKLIALLVALVFILGMSAAAAAVPADVEGKDCEEAVGKLFSVDVMEGFPDETFRPDADITRAEFSKIAVLALGLGESAKASQGEEPFDDTPGHAWYSGYVTVAADRGLIEGYPDGTFRPNENMTNAEAMTILVRMVGLGPVVEREGTWPSNYIGRASTEGILDNVSIAGGEAANRCDVAIMLVDTLDVETWTSIGYDDAGEVQYGRSGTNLLAERLNVIEVEDAIVSDIERVGTDEGEIELTFTKDHWLYEEEWAKDTDEIFDLVTGQCPEYLFGLEVDAWINEDDEIVWAGVQTDAENILYDSIAGVNEEEGKIELKVKDDEFDSAIEEDQVFINFEEPGNPGNNDERGLYGKFILNDDGDIRFINVFDFEGGEAEAGFVTGVDEEEIEIRDGDEELEFYLDEYDDVYVYNKQFEKIGTDAIVEGVVLYSWEDENDDDEINIVVVDDTVTGTMDRTGSDYIRVDGDDYNVIEEGYIGETRSTFSLDENDTFDLYDGNVEDASDLIGETVLLTQDINQEFRHVSGDVEVVTDLQYGIAMDAYEIGRNAYVEVFTQDGEAVEYVFEENDDAKAPEHVEQGNAWNIIDHFDPDDGSGVDHVAGGDFFSVAFALNQDGEIAEEEFWALPNMVSKEVDEKKVRWLSGLYPDDDHNYIEDGSDENRSYIADDTVLMRYQGDEDEDLVDWNRIKGADGDDDIRAVVVGDENRDAAYVGIYNNYAKLVDDELYGVVVEDAFYDGDDWISTIDIAGLGEMEYIVDDSNNLFEGDVLEFEPTVDDELQLVEGDWNDVGYQFFGATKDERSGVGEEVYVYSDVYYEVKERDGNDLRVAKGESTKDPFTAGSNNGKWFRVAEDAVIYKVDEDGDLDGTERLTRIRSGDNIVFVVDEDEVIQAIIKLDEDYETNQIR